MNYLFETIITILFIIFLFLTLSIFVTVMIPAIIVFQIIYSIHKRLF